MAMVGTHGADLAACDLQRCFNKFSAEKSPAAFDENISHDAAP